MRLKIERPFGKREKLLVLLKKEEKSTYQRWDAARYRACVLSLLYFAVIARDCESAAMTITTITSEELCLGVVFY